MQQETLQDLKTVNFASENITDFDPKLSISNWFFSSKRKRHFVSASSGGLSVVAKAAKLTFASSGASVEIQDEDVEILPPLPEDESDLE